MPTYLRYYTCNEISDTKNTFINNDIIMLKSKYITYYNFNKYIDMKISNENKLYLDYGDFKESICPELVKNDILHIVCNVYYNVYEKDNLSKVYISQNCNKIDGNNYYFYAYELHFKDINECLHDIDSGIISIGEFMYLINNDYKYDIKILVNSKNEKFISNNTSPILSLAKTHEVSWCYYATLSIYFNVIFSDNVRYADLNTWTIGRMELFNNLFSGNKFIEFIDINDWDTSKITSFACMFYNCRKLYSVAINNLNISKLSTVYKMFENCVSLKYLNLNDWDMSCSVCTDDFVKNCRSLKYLCVDKWNCHKYLRYKETRIINT